MEKVTGFAGNIILENDKVKLIPLELSHLDDLLYFAENEPEIWEFTLDQPTTKEKMSKYIETAVQERANQKSYAFLVFDKTSGKVAGTTRLYDLDFTNKNCSIGYTWYGKEFRGTGVNKNCKYLLFKFIFEDLGWERIQFRADAKNTISINAIKSLGCTEEGILRSNMYLRNGGRRDSMVLSVLKNEWFSNVKDLLLAKINR